MLRIKRYNAASYVWSNGKFDYFSEKFSTGYHCIFSLSTLFRRNNTILILQKSLFPFRPWQHAFLPLPKPAVTISGNDIVGGIPQKTR